MDNYPQRVTEEAAKKIASQEWPTNGKKKFSFIKNSDFKIIAPQYSEYC